MDIQKVDLGTGEIVGNEPDFVKAYTIHLSTVKGLTPMQFNVLWFLLGRMNRQNEVAITKKKKMAFVEANDTSVSTFSNSISALAKIGFISIEDRGQYLVNPKYFSRSDWNNTQRIHAIWTFASDGAVSFRRQPVGGNGKVATGHLYPDSVEVEAIGEAAND